eukprot:g12050.t1
MGTLRKNPDMKYTFHQGGGGADGDEENKDSKLLEYVAKQREIFAAALPYMRPKTGKIVYMTNSLFAEENANQIEFFCEKYSLLLSKEPKHALPQSRGLDGFFCAVLEKG